MVYNVSGSLVVMFHPKSFGDSNDKFQPLPKKQEPSVFPAILFMVGMLVFWLLSFMSGLKLVMGWYPWPLGSFFLFLILLAINFLSFAGLVKFRYENLSFS